MKTDDIFEAFACVNVLVIGDVMLDRYVHGNVERISPEAPVPVVHVQDTENRLGGAANVALNLKSLGATPYLCSVVGTDADADIFTEIIQQKNLSKTGITPSSDRMTTVKSRILSRNQQLIRLDHEHTHSLNEKETNTLTKRIREILDTNEIHVIILQDYNKGVLTPKLIRSVLAEAIQRDIPTVVDPKYTNFFAYRRATLFKPNLREVRAMFDFEINPSDNATLEKAAAAIRQELGNQYTLITLSDKGMYFDDGKTNFIIPAEVRNIADVSGAGDTVLSLMALGIATKLAPKTMVKLANLAGGLVCEKVGVVPVDLGELKRNTDIPICTT